MLTIQKMENKKYHVFKDSILLAIFCDLWEKRFEDRKSLILKEGEKKNLIIKAENSFLIVEALKIKMIEGDVEIVNLLLNTNILCWIPLSVWNKGVSTDLQLKVGEKKEFGIDIS